MVWQSSADQRQLAGMGPKGEEAGRLRDTHQEQRPDGVRGTEGPAVTPSFKAHGDAFPKGQNGQQAGGYTLEDGKMGLGIWLHEPRCPQGWNQEGSLSVLDHLQFCLICFS